MVCKPTYIWGPHPVVIWQSSENMGCTSMGCNRHRPRGDPRLWGPSWAVMPKKVTSSGAPMATSPQSLGSWKILGHEHQKPCGTSPSILWRHNLLIIPACIMGLYDLQMGLQHVTSPSDVCMVFEPLTRIYNTFVGFQGVRVPFQFEVDRVPDAQTTHQ